MAHTFRLWAPKASSVELVLNGQTLSMEGKDQGWWHVTADQAGPGSHYSYRLDGGPPRPDPRSQWQPDGVHGPSAIVDHHAYRWQDHHFQAKPLGSGLIYEMHTGTFSPEGTYRGAVEYLDHLVELGVTHVEMMPIASFPGRWGWGYDGVHLFAPHPAYGSPDDLKYFVDQCHQRGLAVILDVVYNHLGPSGNYLGEFGHYFSGRYHTPWGDAVNFDSYDSAEVRRFVCDNALYWLREFHFDGLRLDAVHAMFDMSAVHVMEQLADEVDGLERQLGRHLVLIAETDLNQPHMVTPREGGGWGLDAQWNDDFHHALHSFITAERSGYYEDFGNISHLAKVYQHGYVYDGSYSGFRRHHHGRPWGNRSADRLVICAQNHDQIGNRAVGDRLSEHLNTYQLKLAAALVLTSPYVPMLFQGEEWGASTPFCYFTDHQEPELADAVRQGRRQEFARFGWDPSKIPDPQAEQTFVQSKLDWREKGRDRHLDVFDWHKKLIQARKAYHPDLGCGNLGKVAVRYDEADPTWMVVERGSCSIVYNFGDRERNLALNNDQSRDIILASREGCQLEQRSVTLPPQSVVIVGRAQ